MTTRLMIIGLSATFLILLSGCDVEEQMDTMIDNPSFAEPLFTKFMARADYQARAIDAILQDSAMRQSLLEQLASNPEYTRAVAEQLIRNPETRELLGRLIVNQPEDTITP